jgi:hypothetical protein
MTIASKLSELGILVPDGKAERLPSEGEIRELEELLRASLPLDYRAFVLNFGGSNFTKTVGVRPIQRPPKHISAGGLPAFSTFYGSNSDGRGLVAFVRTLVGRIPSSIFPFGEDFSGNNYCLGISGNDRDKVYLWDFEGEPAEEDYTERNLPVPADLWYRNLTLVADSFSDFVNRLYEVPEEEVCRTEL